MQNAMQINAFQPTGATQSFTAAATAPAAVLASGGADPSTQYQIVNAGTVVVQLGAATSAAVAQSNGSTVATSYPLLPTSRVVMTFPVNFYFSGVSTASALVYVTPGIGGI
jgi:hypothetical protein